MYIYVIYIYNDICIYISLYIYILLYIYYYYYYIYIFFYIKIRALRVLPLFDIETCCQIVVSVFDKKHICIKQMCCVQINVFKTNLLVYDLGCNFKWSY